MLMPAGVLVVLVLAAITVDLSVVHLARRDLVAAASAAANDAATQGLDQDRLRRGGDLALDPYLTEQAVLHALFARGRLDDLSEPPQVTIAGPRTVTVRLTREVDYVFAKALPGERSATVTATVTAVAEER